jgi:cleavage stimulation factor subunit 2
VDYDRSRAGPGPAWMAALPKGVVVPSGVTALDAISRTLATMDPNQMIEVLAQMKVRFK